MKVRITVQMHLEGIETYSERDIDVYESLINDSLLSHCRLEKISDLRNPAGPDFQILMTGQILSIMSDLEELVGDSLEFVEIVNNIHDLGYDYDQILQVMHESSRDRILSYLDSINAELIEE